MDMRQELSKLNCLLKLQLCHQYIYINVRSCLYSYFHKGKEISLPTYILDEHPPCAIPAICT